MRQVLLKILLCYHSFIFSQNKNYLSDSIPGWFRFEKNVHALSILPMYTIMKTPDNITQSGNIFVHSPGIHIAYNYFPIKRLAIGFNVGAARSFSNKLNSSTQLYPSLELKYFFWGKNRISFYPFFSFGFLQERGLSNTIYTYANPNGVAPDGSFYKKNYPLLNYGAGIGYNAFNNMTIQFHIARRYWINESYYTSRNTYHLGLYFHFNRSPKLPRLSYKELKLGEIVRSWF